MVMGERCEPAVADASAGCAAACARTPQRPFDRGRRRSRRRDAALTVSGAGRERGGHEDLAVGVVVSHRGVVSASFELGADREPDGAP